MSDIPGCTPVAGTEPASSMPADDQAEPGAPQPPQRLTAGRYGEVQWGYNGEIGSYDAMGRKYEHDRAEHYKSKLAQLRTERDEWAAKWQRGRRELAELKHPGMTGTVRALASEGETGPDFPDGPESEGFAPGFEERCGRAGPAQERLERVYQLCAWLRISEDKPCNRCSAKVSTPCGPGTLGCFALAEEAYKIAHGEQRFEHFSEEKARS